jgi:hypothetical protein
MVGNPSLLATCLVFPACSPRWAFFMHAFTIPIGPLTCGGPRQFRTCESFQGNVCAVQNRPTLRYSSLSLERAAPAERIVFFDDVLANIEGARQASSAPAGRRRVWLRSCDRTGCRDPALAPVVIRPVIILAARTKPQCRQVTNKPAPPYGRCGRA